MATHLTPPTAGRLASGSAEPSSRVSPETSSVLDAVVPEEISEAGFRGILWTALGRVADDRSWPAATAALEETFIVEPTAPMGESWQGIASNRVQETPVDGPIPAPPGRYRLLRLHAEG